MNTTAIVAEILTDYALPPWGFHGVGHWARVLENGLKVADATGADRDVVTLFALFHDSRRENEGTDPDHGRRGADLAARLRGRLFDLPDAGFALLYRACERHTDAKTDSDVTVQTCFDADRLDLGRVGKVPNPKYLCTAYARTPAVIEWAHARAISYYEPDIVATWGVPERDW